MVEGGHHHHHHHVRTVASVDDYPLDRLLDPCNDRKVPEVPKPPRYDLSSENLYHTVDGMYHYALYFLPQNTIQ